jgi:hypothetical protein
MTDKAFVPTDPAFDISPSSEQLSAADLQSSIQHLPAGFRTLAVSNRFRKPMLQKLCKISTDAGNIRLNPDEAAGLCGSFRKSPGLLEECVYLALLIYFLNVYGRTRNCATYLRTLQKLVDAVILFNPSDHAEGDCLIWILTVAEAGSKVPHWHGRFPFMNHMLLHFPESRDRAHWRKTLHRFFWNDTLGREWEEAWTIATRAFTEAPLEEKQKFSTASSCGTQQVGIHRSLCCQAPAPPDSACGMPAVWHQTVAPAPVQGEPKHLSDASNRWCDFVYHKAMFRPQ